MENQETKTKESKVCNRCGEAKGREEFHKNRLFRDGLHRACKECRREQAREYYQKPGVAVRVQIRQAGYLKSPGVKIRKSQYDKERYQIPEVKARHKTWAKGYNQIPEVKARTKERAQAPGVKVRKNERQKERRAEDLNFRIAKSLRTRLWHSVKNGQKIGSAVEDLGCSIDEFRFYLEKQFNSGMTWENWGRGLGRWHIDHIVPLSWFDLKNREQLLSACNYKNLQPLWSEENLSKGATY
jgi:hypothetical protein